MTKIQKIPDDFFTSNSSLKKWEEKSSGLWYSGNLELLKMKMVSIVGSRDVTTEGIQRTKQLVRILVENNFCIVSGLALGVDKTAHEETLHLNGKTIAVMGTPINEVYPKENKNLKERIEENGLVLSQFSPGTPVQKFNFPKRNDLMAALSLITIVVEAGEGSGTRHQIVSAFKYGRIAAFTNHLANSKVKWVEKALKEEKSFVISDSKNFIDFLNNLENEKKEQVSVQLALF